MQDFNFVKIKTGQLSGWYGEVRTPEELVSFLNTFIVPKAVGGIKDYCESKEARRDGQPRDHYRFDYGRVCNVIHEKRQREGKRTDIFDLAQTIDEWLLIPKLKALESGPIYIGIAGGWCTLGNSEIVETRLSHFFPQSESRDIRIIQWPNGKHFYAKIGDQDVFEKNSNGDVIKQKWDTETEARTAAEKFLVRKYNKA